MFPIFLLQGNPPPKPSSSSRAIHPESLRVVARFNERRCKGLPLYGEDLITSLTVVNSARPARTRFGGMGYVNCLNASSTSAAQQQHLRQRRLSARVPNGGGGRPSKGFCRRDAGGDFRYKTAALSRLVSHCSMPTSSSPPELRLPGGSSDQLRLREGWNAGVQEAEWRLMPVLKQLSSKYGLPVAAEATEAEEEKGGSLREVSTRRLNTVPNAGVAGSRTVPSAKLEELLRILNEVRRRRGKAVVFCETDAALQLLRRSFLRSRQPFVFLDPSASKTVRVRQLERFARHPSLHWLLASPGCVPAGLPALLGGDATSISTAVFFDCPATFSPGFSSLWRPALLLGRRGGENKEAALEVRSLVCEGTVEDNIVRRGCQERLLCDVVSTSNGQAPENGVLPKVRRQTLEELLGFNGVRRTGNNRADDIDGCENEARKKRTFVAKANIAITILFISGFPRPAAPPREQR